MPSSNPRLLLPLALLLAAMVLTVAGSATAGYWNVKYDLAPGSNIQTVNPGGTFNDPITGYLTIEYGAASMSGALTSARLVSGQIANTLNQPAGLLTVTGSITNALHPVGHEQGYDGTPGTLSGVALNFAVVADHTISGFIHCADLTGGSTGFCGLFFSGIPSSTNIPQTGTGTFPLPTFNFAATAGVGDFTSTPSVQTPQSGVVVTTTYVGKEISRVWVNSVPLFGPLEISLLAAGLLGGGGALAARRRSA